MTRDVKFAYDVRAEAQAGFDLEVDIYQAIGGGDPLFGGGVSAEGVLMALRQNASANVLVRINSPGGSVTEGFAIYNHLMEHRGKVTTRVDGLAGSMASVLMLAGDERQIAFGGTVMIHNPFGIVEGESRELRGIADMLDRQRAEMVAIYSKRTGLSAARVMKMMDETTWLGADEALDRGFATRVTGTPARMVASALPDDLKLAPPKIRALLRAQASELLEQLKEETESPPVGAQGKAPGSKAAMTEEEMKAAVAKAVSDAQAAVDAIAKKDEEIAKLKGELEAKGKNPFADDEAKAKAEAEAKAKAEEEECAKNPFADDEAKAVLAAAMALTGEKDPAKVEGVLMAMADRGLTSKQADRKAFVAALVKDGKLMPARKGWAETCSQAALDAYLEGTGGKKVGPLGVEHRADEEKARREAADVESITLTKEDITIARTMGVTPEKALEMKKFQATNGYARTS